MNLLVRKLSIVFGFVLLFGGALGFNYLKNQKQPTKKKETQTREVVQSVQTISVETKTIATELVIEGRLEPYFKIDIFSEVSGKLVGTQHPYKNGSFFKKGEILLKMENRELTMSLIAQRAALLKNISQMMPDLKIDFPKSYKNWKSYLDSFSVRKINPPFPEPLDDKERFFIADKNLVNQFYNIRSKEELLAKYTIYAPFSGVLQNAANISRGAFIRAGQNLGSLMNSFYYEMAANVRLEDLEHIRIKQVVNLNSSDTEGQWKGYVKRINTQIDPSTQMVTVYIGVDGHHLKEGMYLKGKLAANTFAEAVKVSRDLIVNDNSIFVVEENSRLQLQPIEVLSMNNETAVVTGLENGNVLLKNIFPGIHNGQKVSVVKTGDEEIEDSFDIVEEQEVN